VVLVFAAGCVSHAVVAPRGVQVWESRNSDAITEGETTLDVDPQTAYATAVDYKRWSAIFPDVVHVDVTSTAGVDARVTLVHADGNRDNVHFHNQPGAGIVWFEDTGGAAQVWAEIAFQPGDRPNTTRVHSRLYASVHGIASLFVSDAHVRELREQRVSDDLVHLHAYFANRYAVSRSRR